MNWRGAGKAHRSTKERKNKVNYEGAVTIKFDSSTTTRSALEALGAAYAELPGWVIAEWKDQVEQFRRFVGAFHWEEGRCASMVLRNCFPAEEEFGRAVRGVLRIVADNVQDKPFSLQAACDAEGGPACDVVSTYVGFGDITVTETVYPCGRLSLADFHCPECGNSIVSAEECHPDVVYVCEECGRSVQFSEECSAYAPRTQGYSVRVKHSR